MSHLIDLDVAFYMHLTWQFDSIWPCKMRRLNQALVNPKKNGTLRNYSKLYEEIISCQHGVWQS